MPCKNCNSFTSSTLDDFCNAQCALEYDTRMRSTYPDYDLRDDPGRCDHCGSTSHEFRSIKHTPAKVSVKSQSDPNFSSEEIREVSVSSYYCHDCQQEFTEVVIGDELDPIEFEIARRAHKEQRET